MKTFDTVAGLQAHLDQLRKAGKKIGFVPTMGALHNGHMSLIKEAKKHSDATVCSIFVNPTQFDEKSDLDKYPRTLEADSKLLAAEGNEVVFAPSVKEVYPQGTSKGLDLDFGYLANCMEGASRPGHFDGMAQVVSRLLDIVQPDSLYMGQKDYQQFAIVQSMVAQQGRKLQLYRCPIIREEDGLAMSSRNRRIPGENRLIAPMIYRIIKGIKDNPLDLTVPELRYWAMTSLEMTGFKPLYVEIVNAKTLAPVDHLQDPDGVVVCVATWLGEVRLIDNMIIS